MLILRTGFHMLAISIPIPPVAIAGAVLFIVIGVLALAKGRSVVGWITATLPRARKIGVGYDVLTVSVSHDRSNRRRNVRSTPITLDPEIVRP
jgi:hypothetical protein